MDLVFFNEGRDEEAPFWSLTGRKTWDGRPDQPSPAGDSGLGFDHT